MKTSEQWISHFEKNLQKKRVDWRLTPAITEPQRRKIIRSLQAWQLGETSDGAHLIKASDLYADSFGDNQYKQAVRLFIREEQKHGENLGKYLDAIGEPRLKKDWGDTLFRKVRYFNTSMEIWTITVIIVESFAQLYYKAIADATQCTLLKQVCMDILIDEGYHITFQLERLSIITAQRSRVALNLTLLAYRALFKIIFTAVWIGHGKAFKAGGVSFQKLLRSSTGKFNFIAYRLAAYHLEQSRTKLETSFIITK